MQQDRCRCGLIWSSSNVHRRAIICGVAGAREKTEEGILHGTARRRPGGLVHEPELKALIIRRGAEGSEIYTDGKRIEIPPAKPAETADPTGCGGAYRADLLYGLMNDLDWETTGRIASLIGAIKIECHGSQNHRFQWSDFEARFEESFGRSI